MHILQCIFLKFLEHINLGPNNNSYLFVWSHVYSLIRQPNTLTNAWSQNSDYNNYNVIIIRNIMFGLKTLPYAPTMAVRRNQWAWKRTRIACASRAACEPTPLTTVSSSNGSCGRGPRQRRPSYTSNSRQAWQLLATTSPPHCPARRTIRPLQD